MGAIDNVFGMDWSDAQYIGDGVYIRDATDHLGIKAVAIRTDREWQHHVIVLEAKVFSTFVEMGDAYFGRKSSGST